MNYNNSPGPVSILSFYIPPEAQWLFYIVMALFIAAIIWHAHRQHRGW